MLKGSLIFTGGALFGASVGVVFGMVGGIALFVTVLDEERDKMKKGIPPEDRTPTSFPDAVKVGVERAVQRQAREHLSPVARIMSEEPQDPQ